MHGGTGTALLSGINTLSQVGGELLQLHELLRLGKPAGSILVRTRGAMKTLPMNPAGHVDSISALNRC